MNSRTSSWFLHPEPTKVQRSRIREVEVVFDEVTLDDDEKCRAFVEAIELHATDSREKSLALLRLRAAYGLGSESLLKEAMFWAKEAIVNPS